MYKSGIFVSLSLLLITHLTEAGEQERQAVIEGNGQFAQELYNVLAKKGGNVFFSPISVHAVLAMIYQGAKGKTYNVIANTLHIPSSSVAAEGYGDVLEHLNNIPNVELSMANKIYIMKGYSLKPKFREIIRTKFLSGVEPVNFTRPVKAADKINDWVERQTKNKIKNLIQPSSLNSLTKLVLVNAIYFKGNWLTRFEANSTKNETFYLSDNYFSNVEMMNTKAAFSYKEDENLDAKVLELPYSNKDISLIIILPNQRNGIYELERKLVGYDINKITKNLYQPEVIVKLPKFKIESTIELNDPLAELGLGVLFDQAKADFSQMLQSPERLYVSEVVQKAFIEVNEEGTEAAAATSVLNPTLSISDDPGQPQEFYADHPFVFLLKKRQILLDEPHARLLVNNYVLFQGRIVNPLI